MKRIIKACLSIVLLILTGCVNKIENENSVKGILYTDQSPVAIEIL